MGSLYAAAASYLDARAHQGRWLLRFEDLDRPRVIAGSAHGILSVLESFGFEWDGAVVYQSDRAAVYEAAIRDLAGRGLTYACSCSRSSLADAAHYPGHCRNGVRQPGVPVATRLRIGEGTIEFTDRIQGRFRQNVAATGGDPIMLRRDGIVSYLTAVVIDDQAQGVTHVVRGADLLDETPRQIHLQRLLGFPQPLYAHVPVLTEADGQKLAKSARSVSLDVAAALPQLSKVFELLGLPSAPSSFETVREAWRWATVRWQAERVPRRLSLALVRP